MTSADAIAAVATAPGRGGIGVVRVSGANLGDFARALLGKTPAPRRATLSGFFGADGSAIDQGIALFFPAPNSFTGEDVLELQGHGGNVVMQRLLKRCLQLGARLAEPGEFTKRAFLNDKLDLAQAESVADLIDAASEEAAKSALRSLQGEFSARIHGLVDRLIELRMLVEASLDFPEEEADLPAAADAAGKLAAIRESLAALLANAGQGRILREGARVVLVGQPNVGKSSLLNQLAGDEVAIVTPQAGTTRDAVRQEIALDGVPFHIVDTAGLREGGDHVEAIGMARTWSEVEKASLALLLVDVREGVAAAEQAIVARLPARLPRLLVHNKIDLAGRAAERRGGEVFLSAKSGEGVGLLREALLELAGWQPTGEGVLMARERHIRALLAAAASLASAEERIGETELFAEELKQAQNALGEITGEFSADDLLGEIFSRQNSPRRAKILAGTKITRRFRRFPRCGCGRLRPRWKRKPCRHRSCPSWRPRRWP